MIFAATDTGSAAVVDKLKKASAAAEKAVDAVLPVERTALAGRMTRPTPRLDQAPDLQAAAKELARPWDFAKNVEQSAPIGAITPDEGEIRLEGKPVSFRSPIDAQKAGIELTHVPFQGSPPGLQQVMGGHIPLMFDGSVTTKPLVPSGKVKLLAVAYKSRLPDFPNVPTMAEVGYPELDFSNWAGVFASAKTPQPLLEKINATLQKVNASQAVQAQTAA